jgi:DNA-binding IclR family transcriptional regulator
MTKADTGPGMDTAIDKALIILGSLETVRVGRTLAEISSDTTIPKPTAHRILATLEKHGFVQQMNSGRYALGMRLAALGLFAASGSDLLSAGKPILDRLVVECGETVHLGVLQGKSLLYIDRREPDDAAVRLAALPSPLTSLYASASGKVLLAFSDDSLLREVIAGGLVRYTASTKADPDDLAAEIENIRTQGYAVNEQERYEGVRAIGVPIRKRDGTVVGALSAAGPVQRVDDGKLDKLKVLLTKAADELAGVLI